MQCPYCCAPRTLGACPVCDRSDGELAAMANGIAFNGMDFTAVPPQEDEVHRPPQEDEVPRPPQKWLDKSGNMCGARGNTKNWLKREIQKRPATSPRSAGTAGLKKEKLTFKKQLIKKEKLKREKRKKDQLKREKRKKEKLKKEKLKKEKNKKQLMKNTIMKSQLKKETASPPR